MTPCLLALLLAAGIDTPVRDPSIPTVGMQGRLVQTIPGSIVEVIPLSDKAVMALWIESTRPEGDAIRYDFRFTGWEPGTHDVSIYLRRVDGSTLPAIPRILIDVAPLLPEGNLGEVDFHDPRVLVEQVPSRWWAYGLLAGWLLVLPAVAWIRRDRVRRGTSRVPEEDLQGRIRELASLALQETITTDGTARLERLVMMDWQQRLGLADLSPAQALPRLVEHDEAGEVIRTLQAWAHDEGAVSRDRLGEVLQPYLDETPSPPGDAQ